jgi:hypothetical protein
MLMYEYEVRDKLQMAQDILAALNQPSLANAQFPMSQEEYDVLFPIAKTAEGVCQDLVNTLPPEVTAGTRMLEHCNWIMYWIGKRDRSWTASNLADAQFDLRQLEESFRRWCGSAAHFDHELHEAVRILVAQRELDSAERKAFVILKERLVNVCCTLGAAKTDVAQLDGEALVNRVFGAGGYAVAGMADRSSEREALRNLLAGLYGTFRNVVDHHDVDVSWQEAEAVTGMINWVLLRLSALSAEWVVPTEPVPRDLAL